jgi:nitrate reductase delta subunit
LGPGLRRAGASTALELRALAVLLDYPTAQTQAHIDEIAAALTPHVARGLQPLIVQLATGDLITLQETYLDTFDRGRRTALNLFEHVHGDSRDRGQAMVDLLTMYESAGIQYAGDQLPDYLPVFLDFLATQPAADARAHLAEVAHILQSIAGALARRESPYLPILTSLLALAGKDAGIQADGEDDTTFAAIDKAYAEAPVNFLDASLQTACASQTRPAVQAIQLHRRVA